MLNAVMFWDSYPVPGIDECIDCLRDATIFQTLDADRAYLHIELVDEDRDKTELTCGHVLSHFLPM